MTRTMRETFALGVTLALTLGLTQSTSIAAPSPVASAADGPEATLRKYNGKLDALLKGPSDKKVDKESVKQLANELFDYAELAKRSMASHWDPLTQPQKDEFVATLAQYIEKNYVKQLRTSVDYTVSYSHESVTDDEATVASVVKVRPKGKPPTEIENVYKLHKVGGHWKVYDIVTDEVDMVRKNKEQFEKRFAMGGYDGVVKRLREKIAEPDDGAKTTDSGGGKK